MPPPPRVQAHTEAPQSKLPTRDMPTAAFTTLGCKVNQYETQRILESFEEAGYEVVPFEGPADVYVINTCSVTSIAESKSRYTIRRANRFNPEGKVVVTGCAAQMSINKSEGMAGADLIVPNPEKLDTLRWAVREGILPDRRFELPQAGREPVGLGKRTRATLKVQDGCSVLCSYCSIPYTRPVMTSRPASEVLEEAARMTEQGYRELILTGVLIGAYGPETGSRGPDFEDLVAMLSDALPDVRLRISSIEMRQVTPRLVALIESGKVVPHLHIPLQSGDSGVLADMNRPYTQADYLGLCAGLYERIPDMTITTDIMVGFPTETEERFASSAFVCEEVRYRKAHVFRFSPRFGTPADQWGDPVSTEEKQRRSLILGEVSARTGAGHARRFLGRTMRVLVEGKIGRDGLMGGLTDNYLEVKFTAPASAARSFVCVRLDEERGGTLYGEIVPEPRGHGLRVVG